MKLIIQDDEGRRTIVPLLRDEITIGRNDENLVRLNEKDVSRKHGRIVREGDRFTIEDLGSFTGIRVNGERIRGKREVGAGDHIQISEYELRLDPDDREAANDAADAVKSAVAAIEPPRNFETDDVQRRKLAETATIRLSDLKPGAIIETPAHDVPERQRPKLIGISGTYRAKELSLHRTPIRIGRAGENDLVVDHPSISPHHLRLHLDGGTWKVMDAESRNGVRVNGEPYAQIALRHGDVIELGHLRFAFVEPGRPFKLPHEFTPVPPPVGPVAASQGPGKSFAIAVSVLAVIAAGVYLWKTRVGDPDAAARAERRFALRSADDAAAAHRYSEALRDVDAARRAGASDEDLAQYEPLEAEARAEETYREMESAAASQDWEHARKLLDALIATKTYFGAKAAEKTDAITSGYVNLHVGAGALMKGKDNAGCLAEAQMAFAANPHSAEARALVDACKAPPVAAARKSSPNPRPSVLAASVARADDGAARQLIDDGNQKLAAQDVDAAVALFGKALSLRPSGSTLGLAYRGMGIAQTRKGNSDEGARYYRLYLPLCTDSDEREQLQRLLAEYDARRR